MKRQRHFIGIDEVGRGPLAGPVAVGAVMVPQNFDARFFRGIRDSKRLSERAREEWYEKIQSAARERKLVYAVSLVSHSVIDTKGISFAISSALCRTLRIIEAKPRACRIFLDGGLHAPQNFVFQETIIKGDTLVPLISAAAIMAKVTRDRLMKRMAKRHRGYGFEIHKGYGTPAHLRAIRHHGLSAIHRVSFCHFSKTVV
ncbi:MAG TPA: ribonuclease HII [Candidatus Paceibacterota bacterium]